MGADPERAKTELLESLTFEIKLANASLPREERRNASKLYHPMTLGELSQEIPIIEWTQYVNNVLTPEILQVSFSFYRDLNYIIYIKNPNREIMVYFMLLFMKLGFIR